MPSEDSSPLSGNAYPWDDLAAQLAAVIAEDHLANIWDACRMPSRRSIAALHDQMLSVLFPGVFGHEHVVEAGLSEHLRSTLQDLAARLQEMIALALDYSDRQQRRLGETARGSEENKELASRGAYARQAESLVRGLLDELPRLRKLLGEDLHAAYEGDPAATSVGEVLLSYPCVQAIATQRMAHALYLRQVPMLPRMLSEVAHSRTGIDIHPGASIGPGFFIDHGTGVVIGETAVIGSHVKIYQGVTLGALSFPKDEAGNPIKGVKRHPNIEDYVTIYAGATVLGGETTIGRNSVIGGNCWVTTSIPPDTLVVPEHSKLRHR